LRITPRTLARYHQPPSDTCYAAEYSFYLAGDLAGCRVLDFGCGSGGNSVLLARKGADVTGVDISPSLIRLAQARAAVNDASASTRFLVASAHDLPFEADSFDLVFGIAILHHLDLAATSREIYRVLRPQGRAIFQEPVRNSRLISLLRSLIPYRAADVSPFERPLTDHDIDAFASGFQRGRSRSFSLPHVNLAQVLPIGDHVHKAFRLDGVLLQRFPWLEPYTSGRVFELIKPASH
jgi:SAM-dependent methyltransferase